MCILKNYISNIKYLKVTKNVALVFHTQAEENEYKTLYFLLKVCKNLWDRVPMCQ